MLAAQTLLNEKQVRAEIEGGTRDFLEFKENEYAAFTILFKTKK